MDEKWVTYFISVIVRLLWSLSIGLVFFAVGIITFLVLDIFFPESDKGYKWLNRTFQLGSMYWFRGLVIKTKQADFDIEIQKKDIN